MAIVNQAFVNQMLDGANPIGKRFRYGIGSKQWTEVVGVVEDGKYRSLGESPAPALFTPIEQSGYLSGAIVARSAMPEQEVVALLRRAVLDLDPSIAVTDAGSVDGSALDWRSCRRRLRAAVLSAFGSLALVLAATGVYGVMASCSVAPDARNWNPHGDWCGSHADCAIAIQPCGSVADDWDRCRDCHGPSGRQVLFTNTLWSQRKGPAHLHPGHRADGSGWDGPPAGSPRAGRWPWIRSPPYARDE